MFHKLLDIQISDDEMVPLEGAPPVYGVPPPPQTMDSSKRGDHSVSEDIEEESISEWEIERQQEKVTTKLRNNKAME